MRDPRLDGLADVLVRYSTRVKKGDIVSIIGDPVAMPLIEAIFERCLKAGAFPSWSPRSESLTELLLVHGSDDQLAHVSPMDLHRVKTIDVQIAIWAEVNTKYLGAVDAKRTALQQSSRKPWFKIFMERAANPDAPGGLRWVGTQFPTQGSAQDAEMSLRGYSDFVFRAGLLHEPDPVAAWERIYARQEKVRAFLQGKRELRFVVPPHDGHDGTDLRVDVSKATWINCGGKENFPDGEVFAGPTLPESLGGPGGFGVEGHVNYTFPAVYNAREVQGVRLGFSKGRVVDARAKKNEAFLIDMLDQDQGARNLGEIAIGTNYSITNFSRNTLFDEKIGGTFHAAVGAGYPESGSNNQSGLHWDMVCDLRKHGSCPGGTIAADGEVFHVNGSFLHGLMD
jgi:aminopeptidase